MSIHSAIGVCHIWEMTADLEKRKCYTVINHRPYKIQFGVLFPSMDKEHEQRIIAIYDLEELFDECRRSRYRFPTNIDYHYAE